MHVPVQHSQCVLCLVCVQIMQTLIQKHAEIISIVEVVILIVNYTSYRECVYKYVPIARPRASQMCTYMYNLNTLLINKFYVSEHSKTRTIMHAHWQRFTTLMLDLYIPLVPFLGHILIYIFLTNARMLQILQNFSPHQFLIYQIYQIYQHTLIEISPIPPWLALSLISRRWGDQAVSPSAAVASAFLWARAALEVLHKDSKERTERAEWNGMEGTQLNTGCEKSEVS